jgi:exosome complex RNA-binding protein Rrp4
VGEVASKRWAVDVSARLDAVLMLSSVNLEGGDQRRRTYEDQLSMRALFAENDVVSAEVHSVLHDGSLSLHVRSLKHGKLENGTFVQVSPGLIKRLKQHCVTLEVGDGAGSPHVDCILGLNGGVWVTEALPEDLLRDGEAGVDDEHRGAGAAAGGRATEEILESDDRRKRSKMTSSLPAAISLRDAADAGLAEAVVERKRRAADRVIGASARRNIARVVNCVRLLNAAEASISPDSIMAAFRASCALGLAPADMLDQKARDQIFAALL